MKNLISKLSHMGIIEVSGTDAAAFLQAQFTSDINQLVVEGAQFSAWCNPQGRVIANFLIIQHTERYMLILPVELVDRICQRLKMYVLRSRVSISNRTDEFSCTGVSGEVCISSLEQLINADIPKTTLIGRIANRVFLLEPTTAADLSASLTDSGCSFQDTACWQLLDIESGLPWIVDTTTEQVLPQELHLDQIGGLSYNKGCYPGQEIIARLHFRSKQKRRLCIGYIESSDSIPEPGTRLTKGPDSGSSGIIINSVRQTDKIVRMLAVVNSDDLASKEVLTGKGERLSLQLLQHGQMTDIR